MVTRSTPGSPTAVTLGGGVQQSGDPGSFEVIGSAENLVGRVRRETFKAVRHSLIPTI